MFTQKLIIFNAVHPCMLYYLGLVINLHKKNALWKPLSRMCPGNDTNSIPSVVITATLLVHARPSCLVSEGLDKKCIEDIILTATHF